MKIAQRANNVRSSQIRNILAVTQKKEMISFAVGLPAPWLFPVSELEYQKPAGGMFLWCRLPPNIKAAGLAAKCLDSGVAVVPGNAFYSDGEGPECIRLNFSNQRPDKIITGIKILKQIYLELKHEL